MRIISTLVPGIVIATIVAGCIQQEAHPAVQFTMKPWAEGGRSGNELLTEHFVLRTTISDQVLRDALPPFMETAFAEYQLLIPAQRKDAEQLPVYLFETREEWARFTRRFDMARADTYLHIQAGGYTDFRTGTAAAFDIGRDRSLALLAHEGFHQYAARYLAAPLPAWLNEGLATQFESFNLVGSRPIFTPRRNLLRLDGLREALTIKDGLIPLADLLSMDAGAAVRRTGQPVRVFYSQLWSTILYLRDPGCPYAAGFRRLLTDAGAQRLAAAIRADRASASNPQRADDNEVVFTHYITTDLDEFMRRYRSFAEQLVHP